MLVWRGGESEVQLCAHALLTHAVLVVLFRGVTRSFGRRLLILSNSRGARNLDCSPLTTFTGVLSYIYKTVNGRENVFFPFKVHLFKVTFTQFDD